MDTQVTDHEHLWDGGIIRMDEHGNLFTEMHCRTCGIKTTKVIQSLELSSTEPTNFPEEDGHYHCWHTTGLLKITSPPSYPMVCCHCGERRTFRERDYRNAPSTKHHGEKARFR